MIDPKAIIHESAKIGENVSIGPFTVIGPHVEIGAGSKIGPHVVINGPTKLGKNTHIYQFASIGEDPQDLKFHGEETRLEVGDNNVFREFVTLHRGTGSGGSLTKIGDNNLFMAYVHIAHDCIIGNNNIFSNNASLSGHVIVEDYVNMGGFTGARQFTRLGSHCFISGSSMIIKDILPYILVYGNPAEPYGLNTIGLERRGFSSETIAQLRKAYKVIFRQSLVKEEILKQLAELAIDCKEINLLIKAIEVAELGISRESRRTETSEDVG